MDFEILDDVDVESHGPDGVAIGRFKKGVVTDPDADAKAAIEEILIPAGLAERRSSSQRKAKEAS